jgi:hypothetical protein
MSLLRVVLKGFFWGYNIGFDGIIKKALTFLLRPFRVG